MGLGEKMAEVRKKIIDDKYNTSGIKKKSNEKKKNVIKENYNKTENNNKKQSFIEKIFTFFNGVKSEFTRIHWTSKKDMVKYSISSIVFIVFCSLFFYLIDVLFALVQSLFA